MSRPSPRRSWVWTERSRLEGFVVAATVVATVLRAWWAQSTYLLPDEGLHYFYAIQPSFLATWTLSQQSAHPPLFMLVLHAVRWVGSSPLALRVPSLISCALLPWLLFRWLSGLTHPRVGVSCALLVTFSPCLMELGREVRGYGLLLALCVGALLCVEEALAQRSVRRMAAGSGLLALAALTHYAAAAWVAALGLYVLLRLHRLRSFGEVARTWLVGQLLIGALYVALYITQLRHISGGKMAHGAVDGWLSASFFKSGSWTAFSLSRTEALFESFFGDSGVGWVVLGLFIVGAVALRRPLVSTASGPSGLDVRVLLLAPFAVLLGAATAGLFPYGGTRHDVVLLPCVAVGAALGLEAIFRRVSRFQPLAPGLALALVGIANLGATPGFGEMERVDQRRELWEQTLAYLRSRTTQGDLVLTDCQTFALIAYAFDRSRSPPLSVEPSDYSETLWNGYHLVLSPDWSLAWGTLADTYRKAQGKLGLDPAKRVWIIRLGGPAGFDEAVAQRFPGSVHEAREFGSFLTVFQFTPPPLPARPAKL